MFPCKKWYHKALYIILTVTIILTDSSWQSTRSRSEKTTTVWRLPQQQQTDTRLLVQMESILVPDWHNKNWDKRMAYCNSTYGYKEKWINTYSCVSNNRNEPTCHTLELQVMGLAYPLMWQVLTSTIICIQGHFSNS